MHGEDIREGQRFALQLDDGVVRARVGRVRPGGVAVAVESLVEPWAAHLNVEASCLQLRWEDHERALQARCQARAAAEERLALEEVAWELRAVELAIRLAEMGGHAAARQLLSRLDGGAVADPDSRVWIDALEELLGACPSPLGGELGQQRVDDRNPAA